LLPNFHASLIAYHWQPQKNAAAAAEADKLYNVYTAADEVKMDKNERKMIEDRQLED